MFPARAREVEVEWCTFKVGQAPPSICALLLTRYTPYTRDLVWVAVLYTRLDSRVRVCVGTVGGGLVFSRLFGSLFFLASLVSARALGYLCIILSSSACVTRGGVFGGILPGVPLSCLSLVLFCSLLDLYYTTVHSKDTSSILKCNI